MTGGSRRIGAERGHPHPGHGPLRGDTPIRGHGGAGRRARIYFGDSGNRTSRESSVSVQRRGVAMPARDHAGDDTSPRARDRDGDEGFALDGGEPTDGARSALPSRRDRHDSRDRRPTGKVKETRRVDLKQAILRLEPARVETTLDANRDGTTASSTCGPATGCSWTMDVWLDHPQGHVANPRVVLEQLFHFSPEEQARVQVTREAILREDGMPLAG